MISIGNVAPDRGDIAPMKGTVPTGATWDQTLPIVDEDSIRLSLTNYSFELTFIDRCENVVLRLATASGEIQKTTDSVGDLLRIYVAPTSLTSLRGAYTGSLAAKDTSTSQYWLLAKGTVVFLKSPPAFA